MLCVYQNCLFGKHIAAVAAEPCTRSEHWKFWLCQGQGTAAVHEPSDNGTERLLISVAVLETHHEREACIRARWPYSPAIPQPLDKHHQGAAEECQRTAFSREILQAEMKTQKLPHQLGSRFTLCKSKTISFNKQVQDYKRRMLKQVFPLYVAPKNKVMKTNVATDVDGNRLVDVDSPETMFLEELSSYLAKVSVS